MLHLSNLFSNDDLQAAIEAGYVNCNEHNELPLRILNYTNSCQFERAWNDVTTQCRGLIIDDDDNVVARPFAKFFNMSEHKRGDNRWRKPYTVHEKMDGSLGVLYYDADGVGRIATRGSFHSDQAEWATKLWQRNYADTWDGQLAGDGNTYLFEIIYDENRIVVKYDHEDLVFLTALDNITGRSVPFDWKGLRAKSWDIPDSVHAYRDLKDYMLSEGLLVDDGQEEGVVLVFDVGPNKPEWRVKVKLDEYTRLHYILSHTSSKTIWEHLMNGQSLVDIVNMVPDEFYPWVAQTRDKLYAEFDQLKRQAEADFAAIKKSVPSDDRKAFALLAKESTHPGLMFQMLDGKDITPSIWKMIEPEWELPFNDNNEKEDNNA